MLCAVLAHRETSKGKAWHEGQCLALFNLSPVLTRTAFVDLLANWGYGGRYRFPTRQTRPCLQPTSQAGPFFACYAWAGKQHLP